MAKKSAVTREDILEQALSEIRGKFGDGAIMRLGDEVETTAEVIPTGILPLDVALGIGGVPRGRVIEIFGPEGGGKTTLALHILAEAQRNGGWCKPRQWSAVCHSGAGRKKAYACRTSPRQLRQCLGLAGAR